MRALEPLVGRWPWPRYPHAGVISFLSRGPARVIVYDVLFQERDEVGRYRAGERTITGLESDAELVTAVRRAGNVVLLADGVTEGSAAAPPASLPGTVYQPGPGFEKRPSLRLSFPELLSAAAAVGHNIAPKDTDGVTRAMSPFVEVNGLAVPSLGTAAALIAERQPADAVKLEGDRVRIGEMRLPLDNVDVPAAPGQPAFSSLRALLRFRGPYAEGTTTTYPIYSFFDVLLSEEEVAGGGKPPIDPSAFRDKIVVIGTRAAGAYDVHKTAFSASTPGMHFHATLVDDILSAFVMTRAPARVDLGLALTAGLVVAALAVFLPVPWAIAAARRRRHRARGVVDAAGRPRDVDRTRRAALGRGAVALWRRGVAVLRRGRGEAAGQGALRPLRVEGRVRPAPRGSRYGAAWRAPARNDGIVLGHPGLHRGLGKRHAGSRRRPAERVLQRNGRACCSGTMERSISSLVTW